MWITNEQYCGKEMNEKGDNSRTTQLVHFKNRYTSHMNTYTQTSMHKYLPV